MNEWLSFEDWQKSRGLPRIGHARMSRVARRLADLSEAMYDMGVVTRETIYAFEGLKLQ